MGEAPRLSDAERAAVLEAVVTQAGATLTVTAGITSPSHHLAALRASEAESVGATAVMVAPPPMAKPNEAVLFDYYRSIHDAINIPLVVQDYPLESGVHMDPEFLARLSAELPGARYLKLEDPPTPPKITRILARTGDSMSIFGGLGGSFLLEELARGAVGTMTGFAYPEVLVEIHRRMSAGDTSGAREVFYRWMPLIRYENQPGIGLSVRKHIMMRRGLLDSAAVRAPGPSIDAETEKELDDLLGSLDLERV
jgi:4-hydroxy-tetrahydrodipicolinate synthase